jgi:hypothetical protein
MELNDNLMPKAYEFESKGGSIKLKVDSPISDLELTVQGQKRNEDVRFPADGVIIDSNFFHHYALLLYRFSGKQQALFSAWDPQQLQAGGMTVRSLGNNTFEIGTENVKVIATTDREGRLIKLTVPDAKVVVERS